MCQCFTLRKSSVLAEPVWRTAPWAHATKNREKILLDHGFSLASLLEQADKLAKAGTHDGPSTSRLQLLLQIMKSSLELNRTLDQFRDDYLTQPKSPLYEEPGSSVSTAGEQSVKPDATVMDLDLLMMQWWTIKWLLAFTSNRLAVKAGEVVDRLPPPARSPIQSLIAQLEAYSSDAARECIGHSILASIQTALRRNIGRFWLSRTVFPLTTAIFQFCRSKPELEICRGLKNEISGQAGFRFATGIDVQPELERVFIEHA